MLPAELPPLTLYYRGSLASCNYACSYCPFAKRRDSRASLARDAAEVARFVAWCAQQTRPLRVLFTPWGEALVRRHYRVAMLSLAALPQVHQVAVQTNLAGPLSWLAQATPGKLALWCTFHPEQCPQQRFLARVTRLQQMGIAHSVGMVALRDSLAQIVALRAALPPETYLWLNAYDRRGPGYYSADMLQALQQIDPWFDFNRRPLPSRGKPCRAGSEALSVDGAGEVQRCHFLPQRLGNLYQIPLSQLLQEQPCSRFKCDCFLGYAHRRDLPFADTFGTGVLARIAPAKTIPATAAADGKPDHATAFISFLQS